MTLNDKKVLLSSLKDLEKSARKQLQNITQIINKYESEINAEELKRKNAPKEFKYPEETSLFLHNRKPIKGIRYNGDNINDIITFMGLSEADHTINIYNQIHLIYDNSNSHHIKYIVDEASKKVLGFGDYIFESFSGNSFFVKTKEEVEDTNRFIKIGPFTKYKDDEPEIEWDKELVIPDFTHRFRNIDCVRYLCKGEDDIPSDAFMYLKVYVTQFSSLNDHPSCVSFYNWYIKHFTKPRDMFNYAFYYDYSTDEHRIYLYKTNYKDEIISVDIVNDNDYVAFIVGPYDRIADIQIIKSEKELNRHFCKIGEV